MRDVIGMILMGLVLVIVDVGIRMAVAVGGLVGMIPVDDV
jgi:hypothetical protein